jgi:hypothetical protein
LSVGVVPAPELEDRHEVAVLGECGAGREVCFQLPQPVFDRAQVAERGVDRLADGVAERYGERLAEIADAAVGLERDLAVVGGFRTGGDPQQGGLARSVLADDPQPLAGRDGQRDVIEDTPVGVGLADSP